MVHGIKVSPVTATAAGPASPPCLHNVGYGRHEAFAVGEGVWVTEHLLKAYYRTLNDTDFLLNLTPTAGLKNPKAE